MIKNIKVANVIIAILLVVVGFLAVQDYDASHGDLNHDGKVNLTDVSKLLSHYQKGN